jgi:predicted dienelactone hydrolase
LSSSNRSDAGENSLGARDFADDIPFVLDSIDRLAAGRNPDVDGKPLPAGLRGAPDPRRIGMFGTSKGGTATALATGMDERIRAGLSMDGPMEPLITTDLDRPFMLMTTDYTRATLPVRHPPLAVSAPAINPAARTTPRATR